MSGVAIIRKILMAGTSTTVMAGIIPQNIALPVIGVMTISDRKYQTISDDESHDIEMERVQVTVATKNYEDQKSFIRLIKRLCKSIEQVFIIDGESLICKSIVREFVGPDFKDQDAAIFMQSVDFMVKYQRSNIDGR